MIGTIQRHPAVTAFFVTCLIFLLFPRLDLAVSRHLFVPGEGFVYGRSAPVELLTHLFDHLHLWLFALLAVMAGIAWLLPGSPRVRGWRRRLGYLLLVLLLGPGLLVNGLLKEHWGRARPVQVEEFGGSGHFSPPLVPSDQCRHNCAFVSGHASTSFFLIALAWVFRDRRWLWAGLLLGTLVGGARILQGAHFLSDVIFSFWAVYGTCALLARWLLPGAAHALEGPPGPLPGPNP